MTQGGPKGPNRTELLSSSDFNPGQHGGHGGGRKGRNPLGSSIPSSCPPRPIPSGNLGFPSSEVADAATPGFAIRSSISPAPSGSLSEGATEGGRNKPPKGVASVLLTPERPSSRFLSLDEAALFDERAAIREYDGGISRAAAERLAWLDVLAARQLVAHATEILAKAS